MTTHPPGDSVRQRCRRLVLDAVTRAGTPVSALDLGKVTGLTDGAVLTFLTEHTAAGTLIRLPAAGIGPLLDRFTTPPCSPPSTGAPP